MKERKKPLQAAGLPAIWEEEQGEQEKEGEDDGDDDDGHEKEVKQMFIYIWINGQYYRFVLRLFFIDHSFSVYICPIKSCYFAFSCNFNTWIFKSK